MGLKEGFYNDLSMDDYHADPALCRSDILLMRKNAMTYRVQKQLIKQKKEHFDFGTAAHAAILQPEKYWDQVAVVPTSVLGKGGARNTKKYRKWANDPSRIGKAILTQEQSAQIKAIVESVYENPAHSTAAAILRNKNAIVEQSIFFRDATFGFMCKIRVDVRLGHIGALVDVKTCRNAAYSSFQQDCANYGYDVQASFYTTGARIATGEDYNDFLFICIEKEPPYCVAVYRADFEMLDTGRSKIRPIIKLYNDCLNSGVWSGYPDEIVDLRLPRWAVL